MTHEEAVNIIERVDICANAAETARDMAIEALKKQIPQKPRVDDNEWYFCRRCGKTFYLVNMLSRRNKYCGNCGQALEWEDKP